MPETFHYKGNKIVHNDKIWTKKRNRHTTTWGRLHGWVEGSPQVIKWSNDPGSPFDSVDAAEVVRIHNEWLEKQTPIELRIIKQEKVVENIQKKVDQLEKQLLSEKMKLGTEKIILKILQAEAKESVEC